MGLNSESSTDPIKAQLLVDKQDVIKALQALIDQYPANDIPVEVIEEALHQLIGTHHRGRLTHDPAIDKLDKVLSQFRDSRSK